MVIPKSQHLNPNGLQFPQKRGTLTFLWLIMGTSQLVHGNNNNDAALFLKGMGVGLVLEYSTKSILNVFSFDVSLSGVLLLLTVKLPDTKQDKPRPIKLYRRRFYTFTNIFPHTEIEVKSH